VTSPYRSQTRWGSWCCGAWGALGAVTREVLEGAAVLGKGCVPGLLERLVQVHGEAWNDALNELQRAQVVEEDEEGRFQLLHDKLREVTYAAIPPGAGPRCTCERGSSWKPKEERTRTCWRATSGQARAMPGRSATWRLPHRRRCRPSPTGKCSGATRK
jgi:hypothetical protein